MITITKSGYKTVLIASQFEPVGEHIRKARSGAGAELVLADQKPSGPANQLFPHSEPGSTCCFPVNSDAVSP